MTNPEVEAEKARLAIQQVPPHDQVSEPFLPSTPLHRSETKVFYEGWLELLKIIEHVRDVSLNSHGERDIVYRVLNATLGTQMRELGQAIAECKYPFYPEDSPEAKIPLELKGQLDE